MRKHISSLKIVLKPPLLLHWWRLWKQLPVLTWIAAAYEFRRANFRQAAALYVHGLERHPAHRVAPYAKFDYAYCCYRLGDLLRAREQLAELTGHKFSLRDSYLLQARIENTLGNYLSATKVLETGLEIYADDIQLYCAYVQNFLSVGCHIETIDKLREKLEQLRAHVAISDPNFSLINVALARCEYLSGNKKLAEQTISRVIAGGNISVEMLLLRGELLLESGRLLQARLQFEHAIQIAPRDPRPLALMAQSYLATNSSEENSWSLQLATLACQLSHWQNPEYLKLLGNAYSRCGQESCAELVLSKFHGLNLSRTLHVDEIRSIESKIRLLSSIKSVSAETELA